MEQDDVVREYAQVNEALLNLIAEIESGADSKAPVVQEGGASKRRIIILSAAALAILLGIWLVWRSVGPGKESSVAPTNENSGAVAPLTGVHTRPHWDSVLIKGGLFMMGSATGEPDENPHPVVVNDFYIDRHEVTNEEYAYFLNSVDRVEPSWIDLERTYGKERCRIIRSSGRFNVEPGFERHPVVGVSWLGARAFAEYYGLRLPTEAEWEYAARGGQAGIKHAYQYAGSNNLDAVGWYNKNARAEIRPVALKQANEAGLFDMSGNVFEWCSDYYDLKYYFYSPKENPQGPDSAKVRVVRGGNVFLADSLCRTSNRGLWSGADFNVGIGFRCVRGQ
ncbi:MAG: SUMF1/EgtB/PvdO family nonheme iron enzyme [Saprospiraceae bacterium]|nr:SUMF1/EgtB/PvdO family nonheme iron enzyme [Saprospiraceae bacterium]